MDIYGKELEEQFWFKTFQASFRSFFLRADLEWICIKKYLLSRYHLIPEWSKATYKDRHNTEHISQSKWEWKSKTNKEERVRLIQNCVYMHLYLCYTLTGHVCFLVPAVCPDNLLLWMVLLPVKKIPSTLSTHVIHIFFSGI